MSTRRVYEDFVEHDFNVLEITLIGHVGDVPTAFLHKPKHRSSRFANG